MFSNKKRLRILDSKGDQLKKKELPCKLIAFTNADKKWHERWKPQRDLLDFPHPYRICLVGPPNSGKSTTVLNILIRARPCFDRIIIIYPGGLSGTSEYNRLGKHVEYLDKIPPPEFFPPVKAAKGKLKTMVIIDDFELKEIGKGQRANLDRLIGHVSTHRNVSVMLCAQDYFNVPTIARRCSNVHIFWKPRDANNLSMMTQRVGEDLEQLFKTIATTVKDSIWIDMTADSPAPLRKNGYDIIRKKPREVSNAKAEVITVEEENDPNQD